MSDLSLILASLALGIACANLAFTILVTRR